jgi:ABC-2 type transport system ATP-binding protein
VLIVSGLSAAQVGDLAFSAGLPLHELAPHAASLEEVFLQMTSDEPVGEHSPDALPPGAA